jgi:hypothetical protein
VNNARYGGRMEQSLTRGLEKAMLSSMINAEKRVLYKTAGYDTK